MDCRQVRDLLFETVDSDLPEVVREELEAHLAQCRSCAAMAAAVEAELEALKALSRATAPADFLQGIHARLNEAELVGRREKKGTGFFGGRRFIEAAGLAVAAMLVIVIYHVSLRDAPKMKALPSERPAIREEMEKVTAGSREPASPRAPDGDSGELPAPGHLSLTLMLKPPSSPSLNGVDKKGLVAPPHHRDSGPMPLRAAPPAASVGEGRAAGREGDRRRGGDVESRRAEENVASELHDVRERAAMHPAPEPGSGYRIQIALDEIGRIVAECGGAVLSPLPRYSMVDKEAMVEAEVPSENLPTLLDRLRLLGETRSDDVTWPPGEARTKIRLSLKVVPRES